MEDLAQRFSIEWPSRAQPIALGSYVRVDAAAALRLAGPLTVSALVWPTLAASAGQCVVSRWDEAAGAGWALSIGARGACARIGVSGFEPLALVTGVADARGSGLRHYPVDTHLLDWLHVHGIAFDVVTDEDIDAEGAALLTPYTTVLTGSHPEYHTLRTLDAHAGYLAAGGRLVYLGGNGFYWRIATSPLVPGVIEVRRAEGGIRAWDAQVGEYYHALDGAYGGLWRRNGRPPQQLVAVGFTAQGLFEGSAYRRQPGADDPRAAWIFAGVDDTLIGDLGLSGGGAAGFELDRADPRLGSPTGAIVVARSEGHGPSFVVVPERAPVTHLDGQWRAPGATPARRYDVRGAAWRRHRLRGGIDLLREPVAQWLRHQRVANPGERRRALSRPTRLPPPWVTSRRERWCDDRATV